MTPEIAFEDIVYIRNLVRVRSAMVLEPEKTYLVQSRLEPLATQNGFESLAALGTQLRQTSYGPLHKRVVEAMTINDNEFFPQSYSLSGSKRRASSGSDSKELWHQAFTYLMWGQFHRPGTLFDSLDDFAPFSGTGVLAHSLDRHRSFSGNDQALSGRPIWTIRGESRSVPSYAEYLFFTERDGVGDS